jgi:hypothetical protein
MEGGCRLAGGGRCCRKAISKKKGCPTGPGAAGAETPGQAQERSADRKVTQKDKLMVG